MMYSLMHSLLHAATVCVNALSHTVRVKFSHPLPVMHRSACRTVASKAMHNHIQPFTQPLKPYLWPPLLMDSFFGARAKRATWSYGSSETQLVAGPFAGLADLVRPKPTSLYIPPPYFRQSQ